MRDKLDNLIATFIAMDTDGDGTVDFHEFCIGMTGKAKGPFDGMSDYDINRLIDMFLDYANKMKRLHTIECIERPSLDGTDYSKIHYFKHLFSQKKIPMKSIQAESSVESSLSIPPTKVDPHNDWDEDYTTIDPEAMRLQHQLIEEKR